MKNGVRMALQYGRTRLEKDLEAQRSRIRTLRVDISRETDQQSYLMLKSALATAEDLERRLDRYVLEATAALEGKENEDERARA